MLGVSSLDAPLVLCQFCYNALYSQLHHPVHLVGLDLKEIKGIVTVVLMLQL